MVEAHIAWCARMNQQVDALPAADALAKAVEDLRFGDDQMSGFPERIGKVQAALAEYRKARGQ